MTFIAIPHKAAAMGARQVGSISRGVEARSAVPAWVGAAIFAGYAILFLMLGSYYATVQNVWIDESTQLLGSRLPFVTMFGWLGGSGLQLGVPPDRMPPISYIVDKAGWMLGCRNDFDLRLLHLLIATLGIVVVVRLAVTRLGWVAGLVGAKRSAARSSRAASMPTVWHYITAISREGR